MLTDELITAPQAAEILGITREYVTKLIHARELPAQRIGPKIFMVRKIDALRLKDKRKARC